MADVLLTMDIPKPDSSAQARNIWIVRELANTDANPITGPVLDLVGDYAPLHNCMSCRRLGCKTNVVNLDLRHQIHLAVRYSPHTHCDCCLQYCSTCEAEICYRCKVYCNELDCDQANLCWNCTMECITCDNQLCVDHPTVQCTVCLQRVCNRCQRRCAQCFARKCIKCDNTVKCTNCHSRVCQDCPQASAPTIYFQSKKSSCHEMLCVRCQKACRTCDSLNNCPKCMKTCALCKRDVCSTCVPSQKWTCHHCLHAPDLCQDCYVQNAQAEKPMCPGCPYDIPSTNLEYKPARANRRKRKKT